jgi:hypothetical protein
LADPDIQAKYAWPIQLRDAIILIVCGDERREGQGTISSIEKEGVSEAGDGFDFRKSLSDVFRDGCFVHQRNAPTPKSSMSPGKCDATRENITLI